MPSRLRHRPGGGSISSATASGSSTIAYAEQAYCGWVRRFILFHNKRHPRDMGAHEVEAFLTYLAVAGRVSASTQNQAKSALLFLYKEVLETELPWLDDVESAKASKRLPVVLTPEEVQRLLVLIAGTAGYSPHLALFLAQNNADDRRSRSLAIRSRKYIPASSRPDPSTRTREASGLASIRVS